MFNSTKCLPKRLKAQRDVFMQIGLPVLREAAGNNGWLNLIYLVGGDWNMDFIFPYIGNVIIPIDELIFFRGGETTNQLWLWWFSLINDSLW